MTTKLDQVAMTAVVAAFLKLLAKDSWGLTDRETVQLYLLVGRIVKKLTGGRYPLALEEYEVLLGASQ